MRRFIETMIALSGVALWGYMNRAFGYIEGRVSILADVNERN